MLKPRRMSGRAPPTSFAALPSTSLSQGGQQKQNSGPHVVWAVPVRSDSPSLWSVRWPGLLLFFRKWLKGFYVGEGERTVPLLGLRACLTFRAKDPDYRLAIGLSG